MMRPKPRAFMPGTAACTVWKAEDRLMAMMASHFSGGNSSTGETNWMPALLTRMSTARRRPRLPRSSRRSPAASSCRRSNRAPHAVLGLDAGAGGLDLVGLAEAVEQTSAPSRASALAMASPMPLVEPVITAALDVRLMVPSSLAALSRGGRGVGPVL